MALLQVVADYQRGLMNKILEWFVRWISGFFFGFVIAVIGLNFLDYGVFSFVFVLVAVHSLYWRLFHRAKFITVLTFDVLFVLVLLGLRLYVVTAPNVV